MTVSPDTRPANRRGVVPIGTIMAFYEFATSPLVFDTKTWAYCNGQTISDVDSPLNGVTLPDLSGRYLVGYGTDNAASTDDRVSGGDIGTEPFSHNLVGNASNVYNFAHTHEHNHVHTLNSHTHSTDHNHNLNSHTHGLYNHIHYKAGDSVVGHNHSTIRIDPYSGGTDVAWVNAGGYSPYWQVYWTGAGYICPSNDDSVEEAQWWTTKDGHYSSHHSSTPTPNVSAGPTPSVTTSSGSTSGVALSTYTAELSGGAELTDSSILTSMDVAPRSVRVRFIMRIA